MEKRDLSNWFLGLRLFCFLTLKGLRALPFVPGNCWPNKPTAPQCFATPWGHSQNKGGRSRVNNYLLPFNRNDHSNQSELWGSDNHPRTSITRFGFSGSGLNIRSRFKAAIVQLAERSIGNRVMTGSYPASRPPFRGEAAKALPLKPFQIAFNCAGKTS